MKFQLWDPTTQTQIVDPKTGIKTQFFFNWLKALYDLLKGTLAVGYTGTIVTAKLTSGGTNGSMTFVNGVVTAQVAAT